MILVDQLKQYPMGRWCRMVSSKSYSELHRFAEQLGLKRHHFQAGHYELNPEQRAAAVKLGAEEVGTASLVMRMVGRGRTIV